VARIIVVMKLLITSKSGAKRERSTFSIKKRKIVPGLHGWKPLQEDVSCRLYFESQREHSRDSRVLFALRIHAFLDCHNTAETLDNCLPVIRPD